MGCFCFGRLVRNARSLTWPFAERLMLIESADHLGCSLKNWRDIKVSMFLPFSSIFYLTTMKKLNFMPTILPETFKKDDEN